MSKLAPQIGHVDSARLAALLDEAGIRRAIILSTAYQFGNPNRPPVENEYEQVNAENDWTSAQVARFPDRFRGFCSVNPLKSYALEELARCRKNPHMRRGVKLHFGNSDVDLRNPEHVDAMQRFFRAANRHRMAIAVHMRPSVTRKRPYGAIEARVFLDVLLPAAKDVTVQIAHLGGAGGYDDPAVDEAIRVFVDAIAKRDPRMKRVWFDASGVAGLGNWEDKAGLIARRIRELGVGRVQYGSDGSAGELTPVKMWNSFRKLPLSETEFRTIEGNVPPYLR